MIDLSKAQPSPLGFIFCFILSRYYEKEYDNLNSHIAVIESEDDGYIEGSTHMIAIPEPGSNTEMDHVCLMYPKACSRYLAGLAENQTRLKIKVIATAKTETISGVSPTMSWLKAFGVSPINTSTYHNFIQQMELFD